jgi:Na+-translocating ferredoxin:NAD+ oxidoreductase RnfD subunit
MSTQALGAGRPTLPIRGTPYPVVLPSLRDPRLHLAAVIISLQVLGQVAFEFRLSIAQILVAVLVCAVLEFTIVLRRQRAIVWPASALLTGNGVAFVLRVPGTEHGDWWSLHGWWIFAGAAALALLSKYVVRYRGRHVFNPSNIGLVVCFLALGPGRADPLYLWWGPMSTWLALALAIIVAGGFVILGRLRLLSIAVGFWLAFAAAAAVLAASGHEMTASWHVGPVTDWEFWRVLVFSPEILVFLFFMITDPKTIPESRGGRRAYAVGIGLLAVLLIAPVTTEFWTKVAVLAALALACAARPPLLWLRSRSGGTSLAHAFSVRTVGRGAVAAAAVAGTAAVGGLIVLAGVPARPGPAVQAPASAQPPEPLQVSVEPSALASQLDRGMAVQIANDVVADLRLEAEALSLRDEERAASAASGPRLQELWQVIRAAGSTMVVPEYDIDRVRIALEPGEGQGSPLVVAALEGAVTLATYAGTPPAVQERAQPEAYEGTFELELAGERYLILRSRGASTDGLVAAAAAEPAAVPEAGATAAPLGGVRLEDVAAEVGLDFRHSAFHFRVSRDPVAMMGGGVCWLDYDADGWLDLFAVNSYSIELDMARWREQGGLPRSALFHNTGGGFVDVSRGSGADVELRGNGCVAADFNLDGRTDLYVTAAGYDALLWNEGGGRFSEGARDAGIVEYSWHTGATVGDVNGDGLPDLFVAGYADLNAPVPDATAGFPTTYAGVRDLLFLNEGPDESGRSRFREVGLQAGIEASRADHGLGAVFTDVDGDGRLDLYVANDLDPNRLYANVPWPGGASADPARLGFRLLERGAAAGVDDANAGMGVAAADFSADGRPDLVVTNSHQQLHGVFESTAPDGGGALFSDGRPTFAPAFDTSLAGWGVSSADLDLDGDLDLVLANGAIPVTDLAADAEPIHVFERGPAEDAESVSEVGALVGVSETAPVIGRGLAAADYDNDGDVDVAVGSIAGPLVLLENEGAPGRWLEVELGEFVPGAKVTAVLPDGRRLVREAQAGGSYLSSEDPRIHFGLGDAPRVSELLVRFPDGREVRLEDVPADRLVTVAPPG